MIEATVKINHVCCSGCCECFGPFLHGINSGLCEIDGRHTGIYDKYNRLVRSECHVAAREQDEHSI